MAAAYISQAIFVGSERVSAILTPVINEIWRYPVKSMMGESLDQVRVSETGLVGDRSWAIVGQKTEPVASAKHPRRWGRLLTAVAEISGQDGHVVVRLPDGRSGSTSDRDELDRLLCDFTGERVALQNKDEVEDRTLERTDPNIEELLNGEPLDLSPVTTGPLGTGAPAGTLFDYAPIHVIASSTLKALGEGGDPTRGDGRRFRPNIVVDLDGPAFQENGWPGKRLVFEGGVTLKIIVPTPRCIVPSLPQVGLERSVDTIRSIARLNRIEIDGYGTHSCVGAYAKVVTGGALIKGSKVELG